MGLLVAFVVLLVLGYRRHTRVSRIEANLRISRDRANFDLQMISHQVQVSVHIQSDESVSLPDSLASKRPASLRKAQATSLPPGPPSSSNDQSVVEQEEEPALSAAPAGTWHANRFGAAANSGEEPTAPTPSTVSTTVGVFSLLRRASFSAPSKRPAPPEPAYAPRAKRAVTLNSPPALLPPGAPPASESSIAPPPASLQSLAAEGESAQSSGSALTAPALRLGEGLEEVVELTEEEVAAVLEDEEVISEIQDIIDTAHDKPTNLKQTFVELVMCDFTPRHPRELPTSRWVSFDRLYQLFQPHAAVSQRGPGNLRLRIIEWYKDDPAFIGLAPREWCKRVTSNDAPQNGSGKTYLYKFCFEYTPRLHLSGL